MIKKLEKLDDATLNQIMKIWLETNISAHSFISKKYWEDNYDMVKSALPMADLYIYQEQNIIKGFIGIANNSYIAGIFVLAQYQSKSIGKKLLDYCKKIYNCLELDVYQANDRAINFYLKNNFKIKSTQLDKSTNHQELHLIWQSE